MVLHQSELQKDQCCGRRRATVQYSEALPQMPPLSENSDVALWGDYKEYDRLSNQLYVYKRTYQQKSLLIVCSFSTHSLKWHNIKEFRGRKGKLVICNYPNPVHGMLKPYEARVYEYKE